MSQETKTATETAAAKVADLVTPNLISELKALKDLLFDFSFKSFITPKLIRFLYVLSLGAAVLAALGWMFSGFASQHSVFYGLFTLVTGPLAFLIYMLSARVLMEVILAIVLVAEKMRESLPSRPPHSPNDPRD